MTTLTIKIDLESDLTVSCISGCDPEVELESFEAAFMSALDRAAEGRDYRVLRSSDRGYLEHTTTEDEQALWQEAHDRCSRAADGSWS